VHREATTVGTPTRRVGAVVVVVAVLVGVALLVVARSHWFFADDWTFLNRAHAGELNYWVRPYSGHWMAATVAWFAVTKSVVGLGSYLPYVFPAVAAHVTTVVLLWRWQVRDGVPPVLAATVVLPFLVLGVAWENVFFAVNVGFNLSLALALGFGVLVDVDPVRRSGARLAAAAVLALGSVVTTTTGPLVVAAIGVALLLRRDRVGAVLGAGPALVVYGAWLVLAGGGGGLEGGAPGALARYVWRLLASGAGRPLGLAAPWLAGVVLGGLVVVAAVRRRPALRSTTVALALAGVAFAAATAMARLTFGESTWLSPRYLYVVAACTLPLVGVALARLVGSDRRLLGAVAAVLVVAAGVNAVDLWTAQREVAGIKQHLRTRHLAAAQLLADGLAPVPINVDRYWSPNLHWTHLEDYVAAGQIAVPDEPVPDPWRLEARIELRSVLHGPQPFDRLTEPDLAGADADGCAMLGPGEATEVGLDGPAGLEFRFETPTIARLQTTTASGRTTAIPRLLDLRTPSPRAWWVSLEEPVSMTLTVDDGATVCVLDEAAARVYDDTEPG
jgi:hypothetical protein